MVFSVPTQHVHCRSGPQQQQGVVPGPAGAVAAGGARAARDRRLPARPHAARARQPARHLRRERARGNITHTSISSL